jgi:hypothetical protein
MRKDRSEVDAYPERKHKKALSKDVKAFIKDV